MDKRKLIISIGILVVVGLHAVPVLQRLDGKRQTLWPIMAWGMYRYSFDSSSPVQTRITRLIGIMANGEKWGITPRDIGLSSYAVERQYLMPMRKADSSVAKALAGRLNRQRENPIVELRLESETYTITNTGIVREDNPVVAYRIVE